MIAKAFTVEGTTITHEKGGRRVSGAAEVQQNGDILWNHDGGKWASRRKVLRMAREPADTDISHIGGPTAPIDPEFADGSSFIMTVAADQRFCKEHVAEEQHGAAQGCRRDHLHVSSADVVFYRARASVSA